MTLNEAQPLAKEFQRITHKSLFELVSPAWVVMGQCIPDPIKIDEWLKTPDGVSTQQWLAQKHGQRAADIILELLNDEADVPPRLQEL